MTDDKPKGKRRFFRSKPVDPAFRKLMGIMVVVVVIGAILTPVGEIMLDSPMLKNAGFTIVLIGAVFYFVLRHLGHRKLRQRQGGGGA
mgnify:CR=1 FL=1